MKNELIKYKHYLLILGALLVTSFVFEPLWQAVLDLQKQTQLKQARADKVSSLVSVEEQIEKQAGLMSIRTLKLQPYLFPASSEAEFKLLAQGKIESVLSDASCRPDRIGWLSRTKVDDSLIRWTLEARYRGNASCALKATRGFESMTPVVKIASYSYGGSEVSGKKNNSMVILVNLVMWQNAQQVDL